MPRGSNSNSRGKSGGSRNGSNRNASSSDNSRGGRSNSSHRNEYDDFMISYGLKPWEFEEGRALMDTLDEADRESKRQSRK